MVIAFLTTDNREPFRQYDNPTPWFGTAPEALLQGFAGMSGIKVHVITCTQRPMRSPEKLADNIWFHSLHVPKLGWMRTFYQGCIRATRRKLQEFKPDIVHGQGTERECAISAVLSGFPNVVTIHGNMNAIADLHRSRIGSFQWLAARLENFTLPRTAGIICISDYVKNLVARHRVRTWVLPNAIQKMFFDFPKEPQSPLTKPLLINVGVISERKRQQQILAVLESLRREGLNFDVLFVGRLDRQLPYAARFQQMLTNTQEQWKGLEHIPHLNDADFCRLFDRASAMIHFSNEESFGLTFAEAIARGLYLFASDVGAIHDIAEGIERVHIFPLDKWEGLKDALRQWLASKAYQQVRPARPPSEFIQRYHPLFIAQKHLDIYCEVLSTRS